MTDSTIRWGILGTGAIASAFARGLDHVPDAELVAIGSRTQAGADAFAARHGVNRAHGSHESLLADPAVDVVYVATPNEVHLDNALAVIAAGKAVLCEKPFTLDRADGARLVQAAVDAGVFCMEGMWMRCSPVVREVLRLTEGGRLGELRMLSAQLGFPNEVDPSSRFFSQPGGGALLDLGVYPVSLAHALFGAPDRVTSSAVIGTTGVDDQFVATLDYSDGRQATLMASIRSQLSNSAMVAGTQGVIEIAAPLVFPDRFRLTEVTPRRGTEGSRHPRLAQLRDHPVGRLLADVRSVALHRPTTLRVPGNGYTTEAIEVGRCLRLGLTESPVMPLAATLEVLDTMDAIRAAWSENV